MEVIKKGAFQENTELIQVKIPEGIRIIGAEAFKDCVNLEMVELPFDLKVINKASFQGCSALKNLSLPYGLENICQDALDGCTKLDALKLPSKLEHIGKNAFGNSLIKKGNLMVKKVGSVKKNIKLMSEAERKAEQEIKNDSLIYEVLSNNKNQYIRINGATENVEKNLIIPDKIDGIPIAGRPADRSEGDGPADHTLCRRPPPAPGAAGQR